MPPTTNCGQPSTVNGQRQPFGLLGRAAPGKARAGVPLKPQRLHCLGPAQAEGGALVGESAGRDPCALPVADEELVGDRLLVALAGRLAACLEDSALVARLGGDEFAVLLPGVNLDDRDALFDLMDGRK